MNVFLLLLWVCFMSGVDKYSIHLEIQNPERSERLSPELRAKLPEIGLEKCFHFGMVGDALCGLFL